MMLSFRSPLAALVLVSAYPLLAERLEIPAGSTYEVGTSEQNLVLEELHIGDGAVVRFAPGVDSWRMEAARAVIGTDVVIDASGQAGSDGKAGSTQSGAAEICTDGKGGGSGESGAPGGAGVDIDLRLGLVSLGRLAVNSSGGHGGAGGDGGQGQVGGEIQNCGRPKGGDGGAGGHGGQGGSAGDVRISVWRADGKGSARDYLDRISAVATGGKGGTAGREGKAGEGAEGQYVNRRTLSGNRAYVSGRPGEAGEPGVAGQDGSSGRVVIEEDISRRLDAMGSPQTARTAPQPVKDAGRDQELQLMKEQLKMLQERIEAMER